MIPKVANYKELILDRTVPPIFNEEYTIFERDDFVYPYLETYYHPKIDELNSLKLTNYYSDKEGYQLYRDDDYYILADEDEICCFFRICGWNVVSHYCNPKYQRFGFLRILLDFLIKNYDKLIFENTIDNKKFIYGITIRRAGIKIDRRENNTILSATSKIDFFNYRMERDSHLVDFSRFGKCSYSESYKQWNP